MAAEQNGFPGRSSSYDTRNIGETGNSSSSVGLVDHSNAPETSLLDVSSDKELNMSTKETSTEEPKGWGYMRQKLQKFVAVQTTIDLPKKPKRSVIEQKDFLEKFSTREYYKVGTKNTTVYTNRKISPKDATSGIHNNRISRVADMNVTNQSEQIELKPVSGRKGFDGMAETESIGYYPSCGECCENFIYAITEPYSNFMYFWLYIVIMAIHYNCWIIILRLGFPQAQRNYKIVWFVLDYMSDFIYLMDIVVSMRTSFLEDGIYVDDLQRIALAYVKSYAFVFDILSLIPLDILYFVFGTNPIFRLPRLLKYHRALKSRKILESMSHYPNLMRTLFFLHIMFLLMHWNACFYFIVSRYEGFGSNNWVFPKLPEKHLTLIHTYAKSLYWSTLSLTTIGESAGPATTLE